MDKLYSEDNEMNYDIKIGNERQIIRLIPQKKGNKWFSDFFVTFLSPILPMVGEEMCYEKENGEVVCLSDPFETEEQAKCFALEQAFLYLDFSFLFIFSHNNYYAER